MVIRFGRTVSNSAAEWIDVSELKPWEENPRVNDQAVEEVAASIKRFGFGAPVVARLEDKMIIAGHTRVKAAKLLNLDKLPVRFLDLDLVDAKLLALADNRVAEVAAWDDMILQRVLIDLKDQGADLKDSGFSSDQLSAFIEDLDHPIPDEKEPERQPLILDVFGEIRQGDCIELMNQMEPESIDAIVCDPPYGIGFMGKGWDCSVPGLEWAKACFRVLKPGGHIIAFGATRSIHRLTVALEDAGYEIRDMIAWAQFQGFPKSQNISAHIDRMAGVEREVLGTGSNFGVSKKKEGKIAFGDYEGSWNITKPATEDAIKWEGFGTGLKPTYEPAVLARKPIAEKNIASQVLKTGTGAINIEGCRFAFGDECWIGPQDDPGNRNNKQNTSYHTFHIPPIFAESHHLGRFPANVYQCPKPSRAEKEAGCEGLESVSSKSAAGPGGWEESKVKNSHPTVKPLGVMRWLCRLVGGQPGSVILDPFAGSGTTICAAVLQGFNGIGLENDHRYCEIARARVNYWSGDPDLEIIAVGDE